MCLLYAIDDLKINAYLVLFIDICSIIWILNLRFIRLTVVVVFDSLQSARRQSRAAESWLRQGKSLTQRGITVPDIRSNTSDNNEQEARRAKTNDPLMAERRSKVSFYV